MMKGLNLSGSVYLIAMAETEMNSFLSKMVLSNFFRSLIVLSSSSTGWAIFCEGENCESLRRISAHVLAFVSCISVMAMVSVSRQKRNRKDEIPMEKFCRMFSWELRSKMGW